MSLLTKLNGQGAPLPPKPSASMVVGAWLGGFIAISVVALLGDALAAILVLGSFGATCVLVFGFPDVPFSQPRNVVIGHGLSSLVGLLCFYYIGSEWWSLGIAVGTAIALMMLSRTVHPPAGSNPVIVFLTAPSWDFLLFPTTVGAIIIVIVALLYNNLRPEISYPTYW